MRFQLISFLILPLLVSAGYQEQQVLVDSTVMTEDSSLRTTSGPTLADLLTIESKTTIFYSYARDVELSERFADPRVNSTVLAPTNQAVTTLPRKPNQISGDVVVSEEEFDLLSKKGVEAWVSAHIIPQSPITFSKSDTYDTLLKGRPVVFKEVDSEADVDWERVVLNDGARIISKTEACNGVIYVIDGTVKVD